MSESLPRPIEFASWSRTGATPHHAAQSDKVSAVGHYDQFGSRQVHCHSCGEWTHVIDPARATSGEAPPDRASAIQKPDGTFVCANCGAEEVAINWVTVEMPEESAVVLEEFLRDAQEQGRGISSDDPAVLHAFWPLLGALEIVVDDLGRYDEILARARERSGDD